MRKILQGDFMLRIILIIFVMQSCERNQRTSVIDEVEESLNTSVEKQTFEQELIGLINDHRLEQGLAPMIKDEELSFIALKHSQNMAMNVVPFGHLGFSQRCEESRIVLGGGNWCAENVAMGYKTPKSVFNGWMNSAGHRANIESSKATVTGIAYAINNLGTYYWTQIFLDF